MYRNIRGRPTTRKEYMGGVPGSRITQFNLGNQEENFPVKLNLVVEEQCQILNRALEAARVAANRYIGNRAGRMNYFMKILVYPHVVVRENKQATGAGADRVSQGMRSAYGKPVATVARVKAGQKVITIETTEANAEHAKMALKRAKSKLPSPCRVEMHLKKPAK